MSPDAASALAERALMARAATGAVPSPCISVCRMDHTTGFCEGCLRTLSEIAQWSGMPDAEKRQVWRAIELRADAGFLIVDGDRTS